MPQFRVGAEANHPTPLQSTGADRESMRLASVLLGLQPTPLASRIGPMAGIPEPSRAAPSYHPRPGTQTRGYPSAAPSRALRSIKRFPSVRLQRWLRGKEGMHMARILAVLSVASFFLALSVVGPSRGTAQCCGSEQCAGDFNCDGR